MKITAAVVTAPFRAHIAEVEAEEPGPEDVVIRNRHSFVSNGTERHTHLGEFPAKPVPFPFAIGYQCAGIVEHTGSRVSGTKVGDKVFTRRNKIKGTGNPIGGSHARRIITSSSDVIVLPEGLETADACALVVAQVGYNAASRLSFSEPSNVVVIGDGLIGQFTAQALEFMGHRVLMAGRHDLRLEIARACIPGIHTINAIKGNIREAAERLFNGRVDGAADCVGNAETIAESYGLVRTLGQVAVVGYRPGDRSADIHAAQAKELTIHFPAGVRLERMVATIELLVIGKLQVRPLVTHRFGYRDFPEACRLLGSREKNFLGILIDWE